jgi:hypothetical protein
MTQFEAHYHDIRAELDEMRAKVVDPSTEEWAREILRDTIRAYSSKVAKWEKML